MRVTQPAVLVGPYDWDETVIPRAEFEARVKDVWSKLGGAGLAGLVVYGSKVDNAALAYLTNFTPKIGDAFALLAPDGSVRLHSAGSPHMMVNAQRLTWVEGVKPIRDVAKHIAEWAEGLGTGELGLWTTPTIAADLVSRIALGVAPRTIEGVGGKLDPLLRAKSPVALNAMRAACAILAKGVAALRQAYKSGATARAAVIAGEKAAADAGAADVRVLASMSHGGTPTAIDYPEGGKVDPLLAYLAVRYSGYWAEGHVTLATAPSDTLKRSEAALQAMLAAARAGSMVAELEAAAREKLGGLELHPAAKRAVTGIGLSLEEVEADLGGMRLEEGRVYSLRAGARKGAGDAALVSAMVVAKSGGVEILWSALA